MYCFTHVWSVAFSMISWWFHDILICKDTIAQHYWALTSVPVSLHTWWTEGRSAGTTKSKHASEKAREVLVVLMVVCWSISHLKMPSSVSIKLFWGQMTQKPDNMNDHMYLKSSSSPKLLAVLKFRFLFFILYHQNVNKYILDLFLFIPEAHWSRVGDLAQRAVAANDLSWKDTTKYLLPAWVCIT